MPLALRRTAALIALAMVFSALPSTARAEKTIGLSSGSFAFTVDAGATGDGEVVVSSDGDEPIKVLVYVADVEIDEAGEQTFNPPQRQGASLVSTPASWFRMYMPEDSKSVGNIPYVELDAGEQLPIRFDFTPPVGTPAGDHNVVILFEMFDFSTAEGSNAQVSGRLGARIALRVAGEAISKLSIRPFVVPAFSIGGEIPYRFVANNQGNVNQRIHATVSVLDRAEEIVAASIVTTDTAVFPRSGNEFRGSVSAPGTAIGPHIVEVRIQYGADGQGQPAEQVSQSTVWLIPLWAAALAGFVVAYGLLFLVYRVLRARAKPRAVSEERRSAAGHRKSHRQREIESAERRLRREQRAHTPSANEPAGHLRQDPDR